MLLLPLALLFSLPDAAPEMPSVTVRLVNTSRASSATLTRATREAAWVLRRAGIRLHWVHCPADVRGLPDRHLCLESPDTFLLGVLARPPESLSPNGLGFALVRAGFRNHAAVHFPRIESLARSCPGSASLYQVLAFALTHELGHLLLGTTSHSPTGIMRPACDPALLHAFARRQLTFSPEDAAALRLRLTSSPLTHRARVPHNALLLPGGSV